MASAGKTTTRMRISGLPDIPDPLQLDPVQARYLSRLYFERLSTMAEDTADYEYVRRTLIEVNISLVRFTASRFRGRISTEREDIIQAGMIGLIKAVDRFDTSRKTEFTSFAIPYIVGEIKRFFRDTTWAVHVPRRLQEARIHLARTTDDLCGRLGREPTDKELSQHMGLPEGEVREARLASNGYACSSLDAAICGNGESALQDFIGIEDKAIERVEDLHALIPLLSNLEERDRRIIHMRFVEELSQDQIAKRCGLSQMHVSRLLSRALNRLRDGMLDTNRMP
ncbi:SigB/SigF/SigG family RNA polymerase sigma factor [Streptomyces sp. 1222.5]|uniref:SigB/SigF/SigG family RNA polymerase sigma factor n=1 Tax=Streptomyces sp. 1222.5 TaxID=1881026 RepID=UPI003D71CA83